MSIDLLVRGGRLWDESIGMNGVGDVAIEGDRIVAAGSTAAGPSSAAPTAADRARRILDVTGCLVLPGLIDLHAHPGPEHSRYGVQPDVEFLPRGVTTLLSQGDAGADTWPWFREGVIESSRSRVRLAINLSRAGESGDRPCFEELADADVEACVQAVREGGELIWGIAVNTHAILTGANDPREIMARGLAVAEVTDRPLLVGSRRASDWSLDNQLRWLRPGDVLTYCFQGEAEAIVQDGHVRTSALEARRRGVLFDVGHGMSSFDFGVAEAAIREGFPPDTISTDQYVRHVGSRPQHDLPRTISKLLAAGMPPADAFRAATATPAAVLGLAPWIGTLAPGACADLAVLRWNPDAEPLLDTAGAERPGGCWEPILTIRAGAVVEPRPAP